MNQVFLGGTTPYPGTLDLETLLQLLQAYELSLKAMKEKNHNEPDYIWDKISREMEPLTQELLIRLNLDLLYKKNNEELNMMIQQEVINLVKGKIEAKSRGKELLTLLLSLVKALKTKVIEETTREMSLFNKFREYSKNHPEVTYEEFLKTL